jgi:hypothetical protein
MADNPSPIRQEIILDPEAYLQGVRRIEEATERQTAEMKRAFADAGRSTEQSLRSIEKSGGAVQGVLQRIGGAARQWVAGVALGAFVAVIGGIERTASRLFQLGAAVVETGSKYRTTFGAAAAQLDGFVQQQAQLMGMTNRVAQEFLSTGGAIAQGMGATQEASAQLSQRILTLAADLQSFHNVPIEETFVAIRSGLVGESEPMRRFGIVISEADTKLRALADTGKTSERDLTDLERATARLNLMMERAGVANGDLARTMESPANKARTLRAELEQLVEQIATGAVPAYDELIDGGRRLLGMLASQADELDQRVQVALLRTTQYLVDYAVAAGDSVGALTTLLNTLGLFGNQNNLFTTILDGWLQDLQAFNAMVLGAGVVLLELQARFWEFSGSMARLLGVGDRGATQSATALRYIAEADALRERIERQTNDIIAARLRRKQLLEQLQTPPSTTPPSTPPIPVLGGNTGSKEEQNRVKRLREAVADFRREAELAAVQSDAWRDALARIFEVEEKLGLLREAKRAGVAVEQSLVDALVRQKEEAQAIVRSEQALAELARNATRHVVALLAPGVNTSAQPDFRAHLLNEALGAATQYEQALVRIDLAERSSQLSAQAAETQRQQAAQALNARLLEVLATLERMGLLTDEAARQMRELLVEAAPPVQRFEQMANELRELGRAGRELAGLLDALGALDEQAQRFVSSLLAGIDAAQELARVRTAMAEGQLVGRAATLAQAGAYLGIAGAVAGAVGGLIGAMRERSRAEREAMERLREALRENAADVSDAINRLINSERIAGDVTGTQAQALRDLYGQYQQRLVEITRFRNYTPTQRQFLVSTAFETFLRGLQGLGLEGLEGVVALFRDAVASGLDVQDAITQIMAGTLPGMEVGVQAFIDRIAGNIGGFSNTVEGAVAAGQFFADFLGYEGSQALQVFIDRLLQVPDLATGLRTLLSEARGLDLGTEAGRGRLQEIVRLIAESLAAGNSALLGGLTPDQVETLLDYLQGLAEAGGGAATGEATSVGFTKTITEYQANRWLGVLQSIEHWVRSLYEVQVSQLAASSPVAASVAPIAPWLNALLGQVTAQPHALRGVGGALGATRTFYADIDIDAGGHGMPTYEEREALYQWMSHRLWQEVHASTNWRKRP